MRNNNCVKEPYAPIHSVLTDYCKQKLDKELLKPLYPKVNPWFQRFCADQHDVAKHAPEKETTQVTYKALITETLAQFEWLCRAGYRFELWQGSGQPYKNSHAMRSDVYRYRHLWIFKTGEMPSRHPMAEITFVKGWCHNDCFRAVHDVAAHAWGGFGFGSRGEDAAFHAHAMIFSAAALPALTAETRMQSAWVISGAHLRDSEGRIPRINELGYIRLFNRSFPEQKAFAAPQLCCSLTRMKSFTEAIAA